MVRQNFNIINESEKNRILDLYNINKNDDVLIKEWLSPDEKFVIFLDELYDIDNKQKIGNIWENIENFKFFIKHSFEVSKDVPQEIMESVKVSLNNLVLTESIKDYTNLKPHIKEWLINEGLGDWISGAGEWLKDTATKAVQDVGDFVSKSFEGASKIVKGLTSGDWVEVLNLLKKGALWVARKIRSALYNPIGLIFDAILVATGIGKSAQVVIWGIVVGLDLYELISGNYEDKEENFLMRLLFTGIDIIALVTTGAAAKESKTLVGSLLRKFGSTTEGLSKAAKSNSIFKGILEKMMSAAESASTKMGEVTKYLQKNSPMLYKFISGIVNFVGKFAQKIIDVVSGILGIGKKIITAPGKVIGKTLGKGTKAGVENGAIVAGLGTYNKTKEIQRNREFEDIFAKSTPEFDGI